MTRLGSSLGLLIFAVFLAACSDDGACINEGAVRRNGVCGCPDGTRYVEDGGAKTGRCVTMESDAGGTTGADGGHEAEQGSPPDASSSKPDRDPPPDSSDAHVTGGATAEASVQGGNVLPDSSNAQVTVQAQG